VPEGDTLHRAAARIRRLVGQRLEVVAPDPRGGAVAKSVDGRVLEDVAAVGKNLLLTFEGGVVVRSHLRMRGRWQLRARGSAYAGRPWLVLRGDELEAVLWNGPVLELGTRAVERLGPDILAEPLDVDAIVARLRREAPDRELGDALLDQRLVSGIGNVWRAESLWAAGLSPFRPLGLAGDDELRPLLVWCAGQMRASVGGAHSPRRVYRRTGRACPRCGEPIRSRGHGEANRTVYWCPRCQTDGGEPDPAP
jgi:endonuclease-8